MNAGPCLQTSWTDRSAWCAAISHDLRQSVHLIQHALEPITGLSARVDDRRMHAAVDSIRASCQTMDQLLSQLLDLSRLEAGAVTARLATVQLVPLLSDVIAQFSGRAEAAGVRLVLLWSRAGEVIADELLLRRVIANLLENAIAASSATSVVVLAARRICLGWRLQVRDAGIGIASEDQARIFEQFEQLPAGDRLPTIGSGLGLMICRRLMLLMNGDIAVRSTRGRGCCMSVTLPGLLPHPPISQPPRGNHV